MKLTVEIEGNKLKYSHSVGSSSAGGEMPFSPKTLGLFNDLLQHLNKHSLSDEKDYLDCFKAYTFCKAFPEKIKKMEKRMGIK